MLERRETFPMIEVVVGGEGQTEETFVRDVLAPEFEPLDISLQPRLIQTSPGAKGGALTAGRMMKFLRNTLRERGDIYVTACRAAHHRIHPTGYSGFARFRNPPTPSAKRQRCSKNGLARSRMDGVGRSGGHQDRRGLVLPWAELVSFGMCLRRTAT
jgi:hypothetical protein